MSIMNDDHREKNLAHDAREEVTINDLADEIDDAYVVRKQISLEAARKLQNVLIELSRTFPLNAPVESDAVRAFREALRSQMDSQIQ